MGTVLQALQKLPTQEREDVFRLWGMGDTADKEFTIRAGILLQRAKEPVAARFVWERLSPPERQFLYQLLGLAERQGLELHTVQKKLQFPPEQFDALLTRLGQLLLVQQRKVKQNYRVAYVPTKKGTTKPTIEEVTMLQPYLESAEALYTVGKEYFSANADRSAMTLERILTNFYYGDIEVARKIYDLEYNTTYYSRPQLRALIQQGLKIAAFASDILGQLDKPDRELFKWLCEQGGKVSMQAVRQKTGYSDSQLLTLLQTFENYALAFDTFSEQKRVLAVPHDVLKPLKTAATQVNKPGEEDAPFVPLAEPPALSTIVSASTPLQFDLATVVGAVYQQTIEPTQSGNVPKRIANKLRPLLQGIPRTQYYGEEDLYLEMVFHIAGDLNLIRLPSKHSEGVKPRYEPGAELAQWSQLDVVGQTKRLLEVWQNCRQWRDIAGVHYSQWSYYTWNPQVARSTMVKYLAHSVPGKWYSVASLLNLIWDKDTFALRPLQYGARKSERTKNAALRMKWNAEEGEIYIGMLASTLHEMGIVELAFPETSFKEEGVKENPTAYRLTELGAAVLNTKGADVPQSLASSNGNSGLVLQPNFEILLLQPDFPALYSVLPFAQVNKLDVVSRLTLTRTSVLRGAEAGVTIEQVLHRLEKYSQKGIPQNVEYTLRDWVKSFKGAKVSQVLLLEVSSEAVADELCNPSKFKNYKFQRVSPTMVYTSNTINVSDLRRALEKDNISVSISGDIFTRQKGYGY